MTIHLTDAARARVQDFISREEGAAGVRFGIKRTGCSGFGYTVEVADQVHDSDHVFEQDGLRMVIDPKALPLLEGMQVDFQRQGINATFVFSNPNATGACGCGESFTVDDVA